MSGPALLDHFSALRDPRQSLKLGRAAFDGARQTWFNSHSVMPGLK